MNEKVKFEKWALLKELDISAYTFNKKFAGEFDYEDIQTQLFWECWRAASQQVNTADAESRWPCNCQFFGKENCGVHGPGRERR